MEDERTKLFLGEGGQIVQTKANQFIYQGGYMGNQFNLKIGKFKYVSKEMGVAYQGVQASDTVLGKFGHLTFSDGKTGNLLIFGGQTIGDAFKRSASRLISNSIIIYDPYTGK